MPITTWGDRTIASINWEDTTRASSVGFLKKEDYYYILLENGFKIILFDRRATDRTVPTTVFTDR